MFLSYKRSLLRSFGSPKLRFDLRTINVRFFQGKVLQGKLFQGKLFKGKLSREKFSGGNGKGARRFPTLVTELAALTAAPVLLVVLWRCLTPCGFLKPAHSTGHFQPLRSNKGTDLPRSPAPYAFMVPCDPVIFVHVHGRIEWIHFTLRRGYSGSNDIVIGVVIIMTIPSRGNGALGCIFGTCKCCARASFSIYACHVLIRIYLPRRDEGPVLPAVACTIIG
jgi:hypothetical protein